MIEKRIIKLIFGLVFIVGAPIVQSCSDDHEFDVNWSTESSSYDYIDNQGFSVKLQLLDKDMKPANVFRRGEQFYFDLQVTNNNDSLVIFPNNLLLPDAFRIFHSNGKVYGLPYDYCDVDQIGVIIYPSGAVRRITCRALGMDYDKCGVYTFVRERQHKPIPVGNYYTSFAINIGKTSSVTCYLKFTIIPEYL